MIHNFIAKPAHVTFNSFYNQHTVCVIQITSLDRKNLSVTVLPLVVKAYSTDPPVRKSYKLFPLWSCEPDRRLRPIGADQKEIQHLLRCRRLRYNDMFQLLLLLLPGYLATRIGDLVPGIHFQTGPQPEPDRRLWFRVIGASRCRL